MAAPVYWIGQDGNIYYGSGQEGAPVQNLGQPWAAGQSGGGQFLAKNDGLYDVYTDSGTPALTFRASRIDDPNAPAPAPTQPTSTGTGKVFNQAGADNTQRTIDEIPGLLEAALRAEATRYGNVIRGFSEQEKAQRGTYDTSTITNQKNYDATFMDSIRAGIKGLGGLMSLLRGTGAGGGTAEDIARDTVGGVTAQDIRGGADTRQENQSALDVALSSFLTELKGKRDMAEDTRENNERAARRDADTQLQDLYGKMAGFYGDVGNTAEANNWMNRAGDLTPRIARNSQTQVSKYDTSPITVKAPELTAFAGPTQPSVMTAPNGQVGSGIFTITDPRRRRETAPVGV